MAIFAVFSLFPLPHLLKTFLNFLFLFFYFPLWLVDQGFKKKKIMAIISKVTEEREKKAFIYFL